jgi:peptidoglycan/LPS O-acetylase OafA/YrhL
VNSPPPRQAYYWQLDLLRGVAVLAVIAFHFGHHLPGTWLAHATEFGWCGVDLFFVVSGFLITGILLHARAQSGYFRNFYARRILRIWPLYFALLGMFLVVLPRLAPATMAAATSSARPAWAFVLFVQNLFTAGQVIGPLGVTWSLAIEEQFYFVWPLLIFYLPEKQLWRLLWCVLAAEPLLRLVLILTGSHLAQYTNTATRLDGLAAGCLLSLAMRQLPLQVLRRRAKQLLAPAIALALVCGMFSARWLLFSALAVAFASLIALSVTTRRFPSSRFLNFTGRISYGLYLLHLPVMDVLAIPRIRPHLHGTIGYLIASLAGMYALATLSFYAFEKPILRYKRHFEAGSENAPARRESIPVPAA